MFNLNLEYFGTQFAFPFDNWIRWLLLQQTFEYKKSHNLCLKLIIVKLCFTYEIICDECNELHG